MKSISRFVIYWLGNVVSLGIHLLFVDFELRLGYISDFIIDSFIIAVIYFLLPTLIAFFAGIFVVKQIRLQNSYRIIVIFELLVVTIITTVVSNAILIFLHWNNVQFSAVIMPPVPLSIKLREVVQTGSLSVIFQFYFWWKYYGVRANVAKEDGL